MSSLNNQNINDNNKLQKTSDYNQNYNLNPSLNSQPKQMNNQKSKKLLKTIDISNKVKGI